MKLSIIIPVFNEVRTVEEVIRRVERVDVGMEREIIVVDDGSTDGTGSVLEDLVSGRVGQAGAPVLVHHAARNRGKGSALRKGLEVANGDVILFQDADLELDPAEYPRLLAPILAGKARVVFGSRDYWNVPGSHWTSRVANGALGALTSLLYGQVIMDMETAYKVMVRDAILPLRLESNGFEIEPEITSKLRRVGETILEIPIDYRPRSWLEGKKMRWRDGFIAVWTLLRYRFTPLGSILREPPGPGRTATERSEW